MSILPVVRHLLPVALLVQLLQIVTVPKIIALSVYPIRVVHRAVLVNRLRQFYAATKPAKTTHFVLKQQVTIVRNVYRHLVAGVEKPASHHHHRSSVMQSVPMILFVQVP